MLGRLRVPVWILVSLLFLAPARGWAQDLKGQADLVMKSPDLTVSGNYQINARPEVIHKMLGAPQMLGKLWETYQFSPIYKISVQNNTIHVDDPTGIVGDVYLVERSGNRLVYLGAGNLNHSLVPAFRGKMALVITMAPVPSGISTRVDVFVRTDSRVIGMLAWSLAPLVKPRVEHRMSVNAGNMAEILRDLALDPLKPAGMLKNKGDAAALLALLSPAPTKK